VTDGAEQGRLRSAGAVVWRPGETGPEIALVHRPRYDDWSYPKGKREPAEHVLATAIREVAEETGLRVVLGRPLAPTVYPVASGMKQVHYWAARHIGEVGFVPNDEVDEVVWLPAEKARERLSYERDVAVLEDFCLGPMATVPLILLRHAEAGRKPDPTGPEWAAADLARPLDPSGLADADTLAGLLASYGRCRPVSSEAERCTATVRPYAAAVGVAVETEPAFTVASGHLPASVARAGAQRSAALAAAGEPAVICAHRENLPVLIGAAFGALGARPTDASPLRKGEFWVLQSADGALASAERHDLENLAEPGAAEARSAMRPPNCQRLAIEVGYPTPPEGRPTMADEIARAVESEIANLADRLTAPGPDECLRCFLMRMITEFGCDGTYRWTIRWRDVRAAATRNLLNQLSRRGGFCDCEVLMNVFPDYPQVSVALPCAGMSRLSSWKPCDLRRLRKSA